MKQISYAMFCVAIFLSFVPIRTVPLLPVAPVNVICYMIIIYSLIAFPTIKKTIPRTVALLLVTFLVYSFLDFFVSLYKSEEPINIYSRLRPPLLVIIMCLVASSEKGFKWAFKFILLMIVLNIIFGLLLTTFGEPFESIRTLVIGRRSASILGIGDRITGFSGSIHAFSYVIAAAPIMALTLYFAEKKLIWLLMFISTILGLVFNAERSPSLMVVICLALWIFIGKGISFKNIIILAIAVVLSGVFVMNVIDTKRNPQSSDEKTLVHRLRESREGEFLQRIRQQIAGLITIIKNPVIGGTDEKYQKVLTSLMYSTSGGYVKVEKDWYIRAPASHNHYINIGIKTGLPGLGIFSIFTILLLKSLKKFKHNTLYRRNMSYYYSGSLYSLIAVFGNALFHNNGIFFVEITSWIVLGLICAGSGIKIENENKDGRDEM